MAIRKKINPNSPNHQGDRVGRQKIQAPEFRAAPRHPDGSINYDGYGTDMEMWLNACHAQYSGTEQSSIAEQHIARGFENLLKVFRHAGHSGLSKFIIHDKIPDGLTNLDLGQKLGVTNLQNAGFSGDTGRVADAVIASFRDIVMSGKLMDQVVSETIASVDACCSITAQERASKTLSRSAKLGGNPEQRRKATEAYIEAIEQRFKPSNNPKTIVDIYGANYLSLATFLRKSIQEGRANPEMASKLDAFYESLTNDNGNNQLHKMGFVELNGVDLAAQVVRRDLLRIAQNPADPDDPRQSIQYDIDAAFKELEPRSLNIVLAKLRKKQPKIDIFARQPRRRSRTAGGRTQTSSDHQRHPAGSAQRKGARRRRNSGFLKAIGGSLAVIVVTLIGYLNLGKLSEMDANAQAIDITSPVALAASLCPEAKSGTGCHDSTEPAVAVAPDTQTVQISTLNHSGANPLLVSVSYLLNSAAQVVGNAVSYARSNNPYQGSTFGNLFINDDVDGDPAAASVAQYLASNYPLCYPGTTGTLRQGGAQTDPATIVNNLGNSSGGVVAYPERATQTMRSTHSARLVVDPHASSLRAKVETKVPQSGRKKGVTPKNADPRRSGRSKIDKDWKKFTGQSDSVQGAYRMGVNWSFSGCSTLVLGDQIVTLDSGKSGCPKPKL